MCRKFFQINGLSIVLATIVVVQSTAVEAADGMLRGRVNGVAAGATSSGGAQVLSPAASQYPSSPAAPVVSRSAGNGQSQGKSKFMSQAQSFKNNFATQSNVIAAPNGNTGFTGRGLPQPQRSGGALGAFNGQKDLLQRSGKVIAAPNGNTGITGAGLPQPQQTGSMGVFNGNKSLLRRTDKVIAAPNGNTGITGAGLPQPAAQSGVMYRDVIAAPSVDLQAKRNKLAGGVPMDKTQAVTVEEIGKGLGTVFTFSLYDPFDIRTRRQLPPDAPLDVPDGPEKMPVGALGLPGSEAGNLVGLKPVGTGRNPAEIASRKEGAIDFGFESKPAQPNTEGAIDFGFESKPAGSTGNGQGTPGAPAPAPAPRSPAPTQRPERMPRVPMPMPTPYPYPSQQYPTGPVVISQPVPVIVNQPATECAAPVQAVEAAATSIDLVLEDLTLESPATLVAGPAYRVKFRNQGSQAAGSFQVAILAGLEGKLTEDAPRAIVEVPGLATGEVAEVTLRLPISAMKMVSAVQVQPTTFTRLYVAVDFLNSVTELDESNNVAIVERSALDDAAQ